MFKITNCNVCGVKVQTPKPTPVKEENLRDQAQYVSRTTLDDQKASPTEEEWKPKCPKEGQPHYGCGICKVRPFFSEPPTPHTQEEIVIIPSGRIDYCSACKKDHGYDCPSDSWEKEIWKLKGDLGTDGVDRLLDFIRKVREEGFQDGKKGISFEEEITDMTGFIEPCFLCNSCREGKECHDTIRKISWLKSTSKTDAYKSGIWEGRQSMKEEVKKVIEKSKKETNIRKIFEEVESNNPHLTEDGIFNHGKRIEYENKLYNETLDRFLNAIKDI